MQDRRREHDYPHLRSLEAQMLDALLRIEEKLTHLADVLLPVQEPLMPETPAKATVITKKQTKGVTRL